MQYQSQLHAPLNLSKSQFSNYNIEAIRKNEVLFESADKNTVKFGPRIDAPMEHSFGTPQAKEDSNFKLKYSPILGTFYKTHELQEPSGLEPKTPEKQVQQTHLSTDPSLKKNRFEDQIRQLQYKNKQQTQMINNQINQEKQLKQEIEKLEFQLSRQKHEQTNELNQSNIQLKNVENDTRQMIEAIGKAQTNLRLQQFDYEVQVHELQGTMRNLEMEYKILEKHLASVKDRSMKI